MKELPVDDVSILAQMAMCKISPKFSDKDKDLALKSLLFDLENRESIKIGKAFTDPDLKKKAKRSAYYKTAAAILNWAETNVTAYKN